MRKLFYLFPVLALVSCVENAKEPEQEQAMVSTHKDSVTTSVQRSSEKPLPEKVIGERLSGTVTLLDTINGRKMATLHDNMLLNAGEDRNGWMMTGVEIDITVAQEKAMLLKKGQQLLIRGKVMGEALDDIPLEATGQTKDGALTGTFFGYLRSDNVKPGSVIESALSLYLAEHNSRMLPDMQPFIRQFQLQPTGFNEPFLEYANYESTVDDPSPAYRTVLVFYKNKLIGVVDSRRIVLQKTKEHQLDRAFHGYFFTDTDAALQKEYIRMFNDFINSVD